MFNIDGFTPIFNTKNFLNMLAKNGGVGKNNHMRILEAILFPSTKIEVQNVEKNITSIQCSEYNKTTTYYTCSSFLQKRFLGRLDRSMPTKKEMLHSLQNFPCLPYLLGGNITCPVHLNLTISANPFQARYQRLHGIDCSGLIYYVCNGMLPRNSGDLKEYGREVSSLEPLDMIWFQGHVLFYLGKNTLIESREKDGVIYSALDKRLKEIPKEHLFIRLFD